jgi:hypothetical protein
VAFEPFFKASKMLCRVKTFVDASANVRRIPIWTGPDRLLLIEFLRLKSTFAWRLSNQTALLRQHCLFIAIYRSGSIDTFKRRSRCPYRNC